MIKQENTCSPNKKHKIHFWNNFSSHPPVLQEKKNSKKNEMTL